MDLQRELHRAGSTMVMVTHHPRVAQYAERTIHLVDGRIVEDLAAAEAASTAGAMA
jgi:putative ABC transport system ATP-binding protein